MPTKLFYLITKVDIGGAQETVLQSVRGLRSRFVFEVIAGPDGLDGPNLVNELEVSGAEVTILRELRRSVIPFSDLKALWMVRSLLGKRIPAVIHTHSSKAGVIGRLAAWRQPMRVVHTVHGWSFHEGTSPLLKWLIVRLERYLARVTDILVVVCERDKQIGLINKIGVESQYRVVPSAIDVAAFATAVSLRPQQRVEWKFEADDFVVGFVGRVSQQKNPMLFVEVATALSKIDSSFRFVMVGDGPLIDVVRQAVATAGLSDRFTFADFQRDVQNVLGALDAFVLTSRWEGLPRLVLEAQAAGVPVVTRRVGGVDEAITNGVNGFLIDSNEADEFAQAITALRNDIDRRQKVIDAATASVKRYDLSVMVDGLGRVYDELALGRRD